MTRRVQLDAHRSAVSAIAAQASQAAKVGGRVGGDDGNVVLVMNGDAPNDEDKLEALDRKIHVLVEGLHDHIRMVAESAASRDETLGRQLGDVRTELRTEIADVRTQLRHEFADVRSSLLQEIQEFRGENRSEHKTMFDVLSDHGTRIVALEQRDR